ncbi:MAG: RNA 2',3'-cyclic phosphodiesterase, partial [Nitrospira sp.]|nr:RNA 2',3'-cyclic phosphodiesterase [Nitrospira sp.]
RRDRHFGQPRGVEEKKMIRAFLAVELAEDLRAQLAGIQQDLKRRLSREFSKEVRVSWVQPSSIHLTLKFLGDIDEPLIEPLRHTIEQAINGQRALRIPIERLGVFPRLEQPRVIWMGASESWERGPDAARLPILHRVIEDCCRSFGFASEERPLRPHLTLARIKAGERQVGLALAQSGALDRPMVVGSLAINAIVLMKSELRPAGPVYTKLWEARLAEGE